MYVLLLCSINKTSIYLLVFLFLSGCITTNIKTYKDTQFEIKPIKKIVVLTKSDNRSIHEQTLSRTKQLLKYYDVEVLDYWSVVSPLNTNEEDHSSVLKRAQVDAVLLVSYSFGRKDSSTIGAYSTSQYSTNSTGGYSTGLAIPITSSNMDSGGDAQLINVENEKSFWLGHLYSNSSGSFYTKTSKHVLSMISKVTRTLVKEGYFIRPEK